MTRLAFISAVLLIAASQASTQEAVELDMGALEYQRSCAMCHGPTGKGNGYLAEHLKVQPPALVGIQKSNGGVFPINDLYDVIEGNAEVLVHGNRAMPVWGDRYSLEAREEMEPFSLGFELKREAYVRTKILSLIEFLLSIQES